jgi:putative membrane protein
MAVSFSGSEAFTSFLTVLLGISPHNRTDWWMEHFIIAFGHRHPLRDEPLVRFFEDIAYLFAFAFLCLHAVGAHYTYSEVPYREWWASLTGAPLPDPDGPATRNHFDRAVHFLYGLLFTRPFPGGLLFCPETPP